MTNYKKQILAILVIICITLLVHTKTILFASEAREGVPASEDLECGEYPKSEEESVTFSVNLKTGVAKEVKALSGVNKANRIYNATPTILGNYVYVTITVGLAELQQKVLPCGKIGRHLFENMITYNNSPAAGWTKGESWSLGDSPAIGVALNPDCGHYIEHEAPFINEDTSSSFGKGNPIIRIYTDIDSRYLLEDFFAKLSLNYGD